MFSKLIVLPIFRVHVETETVVSSDERDAFHEGIQRHLLSTFGMNTSTFHIRKFSLPVIALSETGKVIIFTTNPFPPFFHSAYSCFSDSYIQCWIHKIYTYFYYFNMPGYYHHSAKTCNRNTEFLGIVYFNFCLL